MKILVVRSKDTENQTHIVSVIPSNSQSEIYENSKTKIQPFVFPKNKQVYETEVTSEDLALALEVLKNYLQSETSHAIISLTGL